MHLLRLRLCVNMALVIATTYIIIWYIFTPSNNRCQMTFMMEPPKFIPVSIDNTDGDLTYPKANMKGSSPHHTNTDNKYKLFMYSEFGFPMESNIRSDLRDSMPVLFVPGNAGSYQQVRSLASTCIRLQLQSLDASKFIFYTIDFGGELSGFSGQLIEEQTEFVHLALKQITKLHPTETNGIILVGHSVGGFISKVLFSSPNFDTKSVPLLISLASPLKGPFLAFDDKMRELYENTNEFWKKNRSRFNDTIAISISGGKLDRLVPMHLSMDDQFDLSLTTAAIRDIWLPTDHVCITWCRELMQKLAHLFSALMDKKQTRLITRKETAMSIVKNKLLINSHVQGRTNLILKDWKSMRPHDLVNFQKFYSATRSQLSDSIVVLNLTSNTRSDLMLYIDHIEPLKANGVFGCRALIFGEKNSQINCVERIDLMDSALPIPSRRFEPKKTVLNLHISDNRFSRINYIVLDFVNHVQAFPDKNKIPESLTIQTQETSEETFLRIPSLFEYVIKRILFIDSYSDKLTSSGNLPLLYLKFTLSNLKHKTQIYSIRFESNNCQSKEQPNGATILFSQGGFLSESFHSTPNSYHQKALVMNVEIGNFEQPVTSTNEEMTIHSNHSYLEFYIDGTCDSYIKIELDLLGLFVNVVQRNLGIILICLTFLAYISAITKSFNLKAYNQHSTGSFRVAFALSLIQLTGTIILVYWHRAQMSPGIRPQTFWDYLSDESISTILIFVLSQGGLAFMDYFMRRIFDLAIIVNNAQSLIKQRVSNGTDSEKAEFAPNGSSNAMNHRQIITDFDWPLICIAIAGSFVLSSAFISLFTLFILVKFGLSIDTKRNGQAHQSNGCCAEASNKHCANEYIDDDLNCSTPHELIVSVAVLGALSLVANIPSALIMINNGYNLESSCKFYDYLNKDVGFFASALALIITKLLCEKLGRENIPTRLSKPANLNGKVQHCNSKSEGSFKQSIESLVSNYAHLITMLPVMFVGRNMCNINMVLLSVVFWLNCYLSFAKHRLVQQTDVSNKQKKA